MLDTAAQGKQTRVHQERDYELAKKVSALHDDALISVRELQALTDVSTRALLNAEKRASIGVPEPVALDKKFRWRLGAVRAWIRGGQEMATAAQASPRRPGRPTKTQQIERAAAAAAAEAAARQVEA